MMQGGNKSEARARTADQLLMVELGRRRGVAGTDKKTNGLRPNDEAKSEMRGYDSGMI